MAILDGGLCLAATAVMLKLRIEFFPGSRRPIQSKWCEHLLWHPIFVLKTNCPT
jgi:hypothetical protein